MCVKLKLNPCVAINFAIKNSQWDYYESSHEKTIYWLEDGCFSWYEQKKCASIFILWTYKSWEEKAIK